MGLEQLELGFRSYLLCPPAKQPNIHGIQSDSIGVYSFFFLLNHTNFIEYSNTHIHQLQINLVTNNLL